MTNQRKIESLAIKLFDLLCLEHLRYFPMYECWTEKKEDAEDSWQAVPYSYIKEMSRILLMGLTRKKVESEQVREVLMQIERWMVASKGELVYLTGGRQTPQWYPLCVVEFENNTESQAGALVTTKVID